MSTLAGVGAILVIMSKIFIISGLRPMISGNPSSGTAPAVGRFFIAARTTLLISSTLNGLVM